MAYFKPAQKYQTKKDSSQVFMPFGSAMNAFAVINQGKGITADELAEEMEVLYVKAKELCDRENEKPKEEITVQPIKPLGATQPLINDIEL